jgi:hypothetical protein
VGPQSPTDYQPEPGGEATMRLTLRTLLAYMDGMLEAEDVEDIRAQIEKSEFAQTLMHRIREAMGRPGLGAPESFRGKGRSDPNTVAEYLDNTLPDSRLAEFEKLCLDPKSDVALAEVAACHQILTLVLGEAAEIDPDAREQMYRLPETGRHRAPPEAVAAPSGKDRAPAATDIPELPKRRARPEVPEYLREPAKRRRLLPVVGVVALAACFVVMVLIALGQFEPDKPLGRLLGFRSSAPEGDTEPGPRVIPPPEDAPTPEGGLEPGKRPEDAVPPPLVPGDPEAVPGGEAGPAGPGLPPVEGPAGPGEAPPGPGESPTEPAVPAPLPDEAGVEPGGGPDAEPDPEPLASEGLERVEVEPGDGPEPSEEGTPIRVPTGRFISEEQILLRHQPDKDVWMRVAGKTPLYLGDRLVALPTYRPEIALAGASLQLFGGTEIRLLPADEGREAGVHVLYGRLFILPLAQPGTRMRFFMGGHDGMLIFDDPSAIVVLDVEPIRIPGTNPEEVPPLLQTVLYTKSGDVTWAPLAGDEKVHLGPQMALEVGGPVPGAVKRLEQFPEWITTDTTREVDRQASGMLLKYWQPEWPAVRSLVELTDFRRREVQWLATRSLGYINRFEAVVAPLDKPAYWSSFRSFRESADYVGELCRAVARSAESAAAVREALQKQYPDRAALLYRMLWGFSANGLRDGKAAQLVGYLEHESLPVRGLAFWNLHDLTGLSLYYEPEATAAERKLAVEKWRERLESGEIWRKAAERPQPAMPPNGGGGLDAVPGPAEPNELESLGEAMDVPPKGPPPAGQGDPLGPPPVPERAEPAVPDGPEAEQPGVPRVLGPPPGGSGPLPPPIEP